MLIKGLNFMIVGMGVVFTFLVLMIIVMKLSFFMVKLLNKFFPEKEEVAGSTLERVVHSHDDIAVAIAAVKAYSKN